MTFEFNLLTAMLLIGALGLTVQAVIGLGFLISSIYEHETRASAFGFFQFVIMAALLFIYLVLAANGFFHTATGRVVLYLLIAAGLVAVVMALRREKNARAVLGSQGHVVGPVQRFDERDLAVRPQSGAASRLGAVQGVLQDAPGKRSLRHTAARRWRHQWARGKN